MTHTLTIENQRVLLELYALLRDIDPGRWRDGFDAAFRDRLHQIQVGATQMMAAWRSDNRANVVRERLDELWQTMLEYSPRPSLPSADTLRSEWLTFRKRVAPHYESCAHILRSQAIDVPSLRPTNYARSLFHIGAGSVGLLCLTCLLPLHKLPWVAVPLALTCWSLETTRRIWPWWNRMLFKFPFFKIVAHPREVHHVNSATWLATSVAVLALTYSPIVALVALAVVTFADPAAATIGRKWGRTTLVHGRSLEGSLSFFAVGTLAPLAGLLLFHSDVLSVTASLVVCASAALTGGVAELVSRRLDDNLTVPMSAAVGAVIALLCLGHGSLL